MRVTHSVGSLHHRSEWSRRFAWSPNHWSRAASASGEAGVRPKPGGCSGGLCLLQWKSHPPARRPMVQTSLSVGWSELWALTWVDVSLILVSRWNLYPRVRTCGFGCSQPLLRAPHGTPSPQSWQSPWHNSHSWQQRLYLRLSKCPKKSTVPLLYATRLS